MKACFESGTDGECRHIISKTDGSGDVTLYCGMYSGGRPHGMVVQADCDGTSIAARVTREVYNNITLKRPEDRIIRVTKGLYLVEDLERPGEALKGPSFKQRKDAVEYAKINERAVRERLEREAMQE